MIFRHRFASDAGVFQFLDVLLFLGGKQFGLGNFQFRLRPHYFFRRARGLRPGDPGAF